MENYSIVIFILAIMIGLSAIADKVRIPYPVLLISAGIAIGLIPSLPDLELDPEDLSYFSSAAAVRCCL